MAKIVRHVMKPHPCQGEIDQLDTPEADLWFGSVVECSCGKWYKKQENQRDGMYWGEVEPSSVRR